MTPLGIEVMYLCLRFWGFYFIIYRYCFSLINALIGCDCGNFSTFPAQEILTCIWIYIVNVFLFQMFALYVWSGSDFRVYKVVIVSLIIMFAVKLESWTFEVSNCMFVLVLEDFNNYSNASRARHLLEDNESQAQRR